ncbi:MAG: dCTP deaminase [Sarcina sp.]
MLFWLRKKWARISLLFKCGTLSDKDIKKLLGYELFIYPFKEENLGPASYNLTASSCAFVEEGGKKKLIVKGNKIIFPPQKTAFIRTKESIHISDKLAGTYHSKVKLTNKGLSHIGTTLDPGYMGTSKLAIHNNTDKNIEIDVNDTIATVMFYVLRRRSTTRQDNFSERGNPLKFDINDFYEFESLDDNKERAVLNIAVFKKKIWQKLKIEQGTIVTIEGSQKDKSLEEKEKVLEDIKKWQSQPWIFSKEVLIEKVQLQIRKKNNNKDILIYSLLVVIIGIILLWNLKKHEMFESFDVLAILIGVVVLYKQNKYK